MGKRPLGDQSLNLLHLALSLISRFVIKSKKTAKRLVRRVLIQKFGVIGSVVLPEKSTAFTLNQELKPSNRGKPPQVNEHNLRQRYENNSLALKPDTFIFYRILGNDLVPRHKKGQTRENLRFILANEANFPNCEKRFILNRIVDPAEEEAAMKLLDDAGFEYIHLPFDPEIAAAQPWDCLGIPAEFAPYKKAFAQLGEERQDRILMRLYRHKNNYIMNNNGARNAALADGHNKAKWILPWDGNCFMTPAGWDQLLQSVTKHPHYPYHIVPMSRTRDNAKLLQPHYQPEAKEEPQILFRCDAEEHFDPHFFYGRRPKVQLFWRLGIPGQWDNWRIEPQDLPCPSYAASAGAYQVGGWVARLDSGQTRLETQQGFGDRGKARIEAIQSFLNQIDRNRISGVCSPEQTVFFRYDAQRFASLEGAIDSAIILQLREYADAAMSRGPYSVVDKTTLPPSGDPRDYWHPAPYYWPNPIPGLPYIRCDGQRVPGTRLYEPKSDQYDRTRLQRLFDDTLVLSLAAHIFDDERYGHHAAGLCKRWFIDNEMAMHPHLNYAQVRYGYNHNIGSSAGIIEFKDIYFFLDAVRLLEQEGYLSVDDQDCFKAWLQTYLCWLQESPQGKKERASKNNHGTYYDLQVGAIAAYLGDFDLLQDTLRDSQCRLFSQIDDTGFQTHEMARTTTAHYCCFNLQGWLHLTLLATAVGEQWLQPSHPVAERLRQAMDWLLSYRDQPWPYKQIDDFDRHRFDPILTARESWFGINDGQPLYHLEQFKAVFFPHDGVAPFWQLMFITPRLSAIPSASHDHQLNGTH